ncbi:hypothetical protein [Peloplasma aerotolerans]|uniref:Mpv17/PMP22 family protein n=1 Tax=Peloplasma aerotolerans TaxID=3044389 RepID=A0AAW6U880_9MOLU|nr:hypothetical protein [Mariniplasma sp. M4Ah]MDI6452276.1 hypothetical protein [Mariniplasma sp. M4Ah]
MKLKDLIWVFVILGITAFVAFPLTRSLFETATNNYPYFMGFIKTAILASMGEILVNRIKKGSYFSEKGIIAKFIVWGFLGMVFVLIFKVFASGIVAAQTVSLLPSISDNNFLSNLLTAFLISFFMNLFFAPSFMILHRITDNYIELGMGNPKQILKVKFSLVIDRIDWKFFFGFVVIKTIPLFWIPAHTITFLLPENYRVLMAAYLSIALGIILTFSKTSKVASKQQ